MYRNWYLLFIVFVVASVLPERLFPQTYRELNIEEGRVYELKKSTAKFDKITVRGTLKVLDKGKIRIETGLVVVDGGTLIIGTNESPLRSELTMSFRNVNGWEAGIEVLNKGTLYINGLSKRKDSSDRTIQFKSVGRNAGASIRIEDADTIQINKVRFEKLGSVSKPVLHWKGNPQEGFVKNSLFHRNHGVAILLENTSIVLKGNRIETLNSNAIVCKNEEAGTGNHIVNNTIFTESSDSLFSVVADNPYQQINHNTLFLGGEASGIQIVPNQKDAKRTFKVRPRDFSLDGNHIQISNQSRNNLLSSERVGILLGDFNQRAILKVTNNKVSNLPIGAIVIGQNYLIDGFHSRNNTIGIYPGKAYLSNGSFKRDAKTKGTRAIVADTRFEATAPKISNLHIENYDLGIHFEGTIGPSNYIEKLTFVNTNPVSFKSLSADSYVLDRDGSLLVHKESKNSKDTAVHQHPKHHNMDHMGHQLKKSNLEKRTLFYPENSMLVSKKSEHVSDNKNVFYSKEQLSGVLTISTGFGLSDPVHEHNRSFKSLQIEHSETRNLRKVEKNSIQEDFYLAANNNYNINYIGAGGPLYDIGFEWDAPSDTWVVVTLPYPYKNPVALRSFGALITASKSLHELHNASYTTYFIDPEKKSATLKLYNKQNIEEFVLYSRSILTEITLNNKKVPIELSTDWNKNKVNISFRTPKNVQSRLDILDYYGNVVATLFDGVTKNELTTSTLDIKQFDVQQKIFRYSLTVDGKNHKGPIYAY